MNEYLKYYDSGNIEVTGQMINGLKDGRWIFYYETGERWMEQDYILDLEDGEFTRWYINGQVAITGRSKAGVEIGEWREYYEDGRLKELGIYVNGEYRPLDFWDVDGQQLLHNGTGLKIERMGPQDLDVYEHHFKDGFFIKEVKISSVSYEVLFPKKEIE